MIISDSISSQNEQNIPTKLVHFFGDQVPRNFIFGIK